MSPTCLGAIGDVPRSLWAPPLAADIAVRRQPDLRIQRADEGDDAKGTTGAAAAVDRYRRQTP